mmetsp:Transcript_41322/g.81609  ORF Transcript_41322/g.81609 Transcript_41322/m.81609 type:complete len:342 (+) Transcript_41322:37-1062(+)
MGMDASSGVADHTRRPTVTFKDRTASSPFRLDSSLSLPSLWQKTPGAGTSADSVLTGNCTGVTLGALQRFLFPTGIDNPDAVGRLEVYALYGPSDDEGFLRGGVRGSHVHTDSEINLMIEDLTREALFKLCDGRRRSSAVHRVVSSLLPVAMSQRYTWAEVKRVLRSVDKTRGSMNFSEVQRAILESQTKRLQKLLSNAKRGLPISPPRESMPRLPYQSRSAAQLTAIAQKEKLTPAQHAIRDTKLLHGYTWQMTSAGGQASAAELRSNTWLVRGPGGVEDRWDRYCASRRDGRASYVQARNHSRAGLCLDDGLMDKHPGCSSLLAASTSGSSAAAMLAAR